MIGKRNERKGNKVLIHRSAIAESRKKKIHIQLTWRARALSIWTENPPIEREKLRKTVYVSLRHCQSHCIDTVRFGCDLSSMSSTHRMAGGHAHKKKTQNAVNSIYRNWWMFGGSALMFVRAEAENDAFGGNWKLNRIVRSYTDEGVHGTAYNLNMDYDVFFASPFFFSFFFSRMRWIAVYNVYGFTYFICLTIVLLPDSPAPVNCGERKWKKKKERKLVCY